MEEFLGETAANTEQNRSFSVVVSDNKTRFKVWFKPPDELSKKKDRELALLNLVSYYSFPNIDKTNQQSIVDIPLMVKHNVFTYLFQRVVTMFEILMNSFVNK